MRYRLAYDLGCAFNARIEINQLVPLIIAKRDLARRDGLSDIVGNSAAMTDVLRLMETAAASSITMLIQGETGTGYEAGDMPLAMSGQAAACSLTTGNRTAGRQLFEPP